MKIEQLAADYTLPTKPSSDGYYHLWVRTPEGRRQIKAKTIEKLKESLYNKTAITFGQCFKMSQEQKLKHTKSEEKLLSVFNTIDRNKSDYKRFIAGTVFEDFRINEISKKDIEEICYYNLDRYDLTKKGFMNLRSVLRQTMQFAYEEGYVFENICTRINYKKFQDMFVAQTKIKERVHSEEEIARMIEYCHEQQIKYPNRYVSYALEMQIAMGLRRGEVTALKWVDVQEDYIEISREQITLRGKPTKFAIVNHTKTYVDRKFPITDEVQNILERLIPAKSEYLFPQQNEIGCVKNSALYHFYHQMCEKLGIELSKTALKGTHSFRRNAITKAVDNSNGNTYLVSKIYGNSPKVINNHYYTDYDISEAKSILSRPLKQDLSN